METEQLPLNLTRDELRSLLDLIERAAEHTYRGIDGIPEGRSLHQKVSRALYGEPMSLEEIAREHPFVLLTAAHLMMQRLHRDAEKERV